MEWKYIDFPMNKNGNRDLSKLQYGDSLEVRVCELGAFQVGRLFNCLAKFVYGIMLTHIKTKDAYGHIQLFSILPSPPKQKDNA